MYEQDSCFNPRLPGGRRQVPVSGIRRIDEFQSTPSGGKATFPFANKDLAATVSIHAFRGEGDGSLSSSPSRMPVSIHAFRGEGDRVRCLCSASTRFQSTPSGGKATLSITVTRRLRKVSIHAFRGEGDLIRRVLYASAGKFQSTPSGGKATRDHAIVVRVHSLSFNPSLPGGRRPAASAAFDSIWCSFNPRLPGGRRPSYTNDPRSSPSFQSTPSGGKATPDG